MQALRCVFAGASSMAILSLGGCYVPKAQLTAAQTQSRVLSEQTRAQIAEIENLKAHSRQVEDQLLRKEQELAFLQDPGRSRSDALGAEAAPRRLPENVGRQLADLSRRYPSLHFDPETGAGRLDADVLFDSGQADLKPAARDMLDELAQILQTPDAKGLRVMVVGHSDNQRIVGKEPRERFPNNFHLSTARALAVADLLRQRGLPDQRIGVAGLGSHQPVVPNESPSDRQKNRRVEIYVIAAEVPIVGWNNATPSYR